MDELPSGSQLTNPEEKGGHTSKGDELRGRLREWIAWVGKQQRDPGDIPTVLDLLRSALDDSDGKSLLIDVASDSTPLEDLETCLGDELARSPADPVVRAAVLCCARWKQALEESELDEWSDSGDEAFIRQDVEERISRTREMFAFLVRFLPVEDCPSTWRDFRYEILNSYLAHDWERATRLYNRADDLRLKSTGEVAVLRGQFRFLSVLGCGIEEDVRRRVENTKIRLALDSLFWEPRIYDAGSSEGQDDLHALLLYTHGMCDRDQELALGDAEKSQLFEASHDLAKGLLNIPELPYFYRAVLSRCYFCIGQFHSAAEQYNALLVTKDRSGPPQVRARLLASLSLSHRLAGEAELAKAILEQWAKEFPEEKGVYMQLAELESQAGNYQRASEYLRNEIERNPAVDSDWKLSALLALGATQDTSEAIKKELKGNSALWRPISSILSAYWEPFSGLGESAREEWTYGALLFCSQDLPEGTRLKKAAIAFATAVEIELRNRVFQRYREHIQERPAVKRTAEEGKRESNSLIFSSFLAGDGTLTLGQMSNILKMRGENEPVFGDFRRWVLNSQHALMQHLEYLQPVVAFRNPAIHENRAEEDPSGIIQCCRRIVDVLR